MSERVVQVLPISKLNGVWCNVNGSSSRTSGTCIIVGAWVCNLIPCAHYLHNWAGFII